MRLSLRIVILIALGAVAPGLVACSQTPWRPSDKSLAALARDVADHAAGNDTQYFSGLTPDREQIPELMRQVARSGIATNYADHLVVESSNSAVLAYGLMGDHTPATSFAIELSLVNGKPRMDQIITGGAAEVEASPETLSEPVLMPEAPLSEIGSISVSVSIPSNQVIGGSIQSVLIGYTNTSSEGTSVPVPLDTLLQITDGRDRLVFERRGPTDGGQPIHFEFLPPGATIYGSILFPAPQAGEYYLYGQADGVRSAPLNLETTH